jgi:thioredoxin
MKKAFIYSLFFSVLVLSCSANKDDSKKEKQNNQNTTKMGTIQMTKADFLSKVMNYEKNPKEWVFLGKKPCIIDFYATWCGPCKMLAPIMEDLAKEYGDQVDFYKIDTDQEQELASFFGIQSIPTILFCPMGDKPQMAQGALPKESLKQAINEVLLKQQPATK